MSETPPEMQSPSAAGLDTLDDLDAKRRVLRTLQAMQSRLDALERMRSEPIAIIGMGCRLPGGASNPAAFWERLQQGYDAVGDVPAERWDAEAFYSPDPDSPGSIATRYGAFLERVDQFDAAFWGIAPREALSMDPQQRLLLEVAWEALEDAAQSPDQLLDTAAGVFVGISNHDYGSRHIHSGDPSRIDAYAGTGYAFSVAAGRVAYLLGLHGPAIAIDTACSSSLVAIHLACQSLRTHECSMALAGGVNLMLAPDIAVYLSQARALSPDGRCKTFDAAADGYGRGEGCGVLVLKRLSDALAHNDHILALIRGSAVNQDGRSNGLTAPNGPAQQAVIRQALQQAGVQPHEIGYVEAHGTGTPLGDPIEVQALSAVLGAGRSADTPLVVGSVKTNIGHLEAAAGVAGVIKTVLAMQHGAIPPHLHLHQLNPHITLDGSQVQIVFPTAGTLWPAHANRRLAGVSSFGFSGTNAHVILMQHAEGSMQQTAPPQAQCSTLHAPFLLPLAAQSAAALHALAHSYRDYLASAHAAPLPHVCYTASVGRAHSFATGTHRLAVVAHTHEEACAALAEAAPGLLHTPPADSPEALRVALLFTGQGAQYAGMGRQLYETQPVFRETLEQCAEVLRPHLDCGLLDLLYGDETERLHQTRYTQPALFALEYALAMLWQAWGIRPAVVLGHSLGEYVAACVAGIFSLETGLYLVAERGRLMQELAAPGAMAAVFASAEQVQPVLAPYADRLAVSAHNAATSLVLSGERAALEAVLHGLAHQQIKTRRLPTSHAFHSPLIDPMLPAFEQVARSVSYQVPRIGFVSNLDGGLLAPNTAPTADYWRQHTRQPVQFARGIQTLFAQGYRLFVEAGPHPTLLPLAERVQAERDSDGNEERRLHWLPSLRHNHNDGQTMLHSLGRLYEQGAAVDWAGYYRPFACQRVRLPTYPWQRQRFWLETPRQHEQAQLAAWCYQVNWHEQQTPPAPMQQRGGWLIIAAEPVPAWVGLLRQRAIQHNLPVRLLSPEALPTVPDMLSGRIPWQHVVFITPPPASDAQDISAAPCLPALTLVQQLARYSPPDNPPPRLWLITHQAQAVTDEPALNISQAALWGLGRVIGRESSELWGGLVDLPVAPDDADATAALLWQHITGQGEPAIALRGGRVYLPRLEAARLPAAARRTLPVQAAASYLIGGGLGELGLLVAQWLAEQGAGTLVLVGRRGVATPQAERAVQELEQSGARVLVRACDLADAAQVRALLAELVQQGPPLRGIVHAAGVLDDATLLHQDAARFERVFAPKVQAAWNLHRQTHDLALDWFVLFSSAVVVLGSPGQANYAAANAALDALAHQRRALGLPALSINWGPWAAGMGTRADSPLPTMQPRQALERTGLLLQARLPQVAVLPLPTGADWQQLAAALKLDERSRLLFSRLLPADHASLPGAASAESPTVRQQLRAARPDQRMPLLREYVRQEIARVLGFGLDMPVPPQQGFFDLGLDSLMAVDLKNRLQHDLECRLRSTLLLDYPNLTRLVAFLAEQVLPVDEPAPPEAPDPAAQFPRTDLSEADLVALLADELEKLEGKDNR